MRAQRGAGGVFVFVLLLILVIIMVAMLTLSRTNNAVDANAETATDLEKAAAALEQFASASGRLPCPSNPALDDGIASPDAATINCDFPEGTIPWRTVGMRRDDAYDAWGWKISYRVYSNTAGAMTQAGGASMVNCDTVQALTTRQPVDGTKLCPAVHDTIDSDFIVGKGLKVTDFGTVYDGTKPTGGAAFVLISHGVTGMGAYSASGIRKDLPNAADEKNNTKDTGPFTLEAASNPDIGVNDNNHYDDFLLYRTVADLPTRAHLAARDWPDDVLAGVAFDQATVQSYLGSNPSSSGGDTGVTSITFPDVVVSAFDSGGAQDLGYSSGSSPGLGGVSGGSNDLTSTGGEGLRFDFTQGANQFSASLGGWNSPEVAQIQFWTVDSTTNVATWIGTKSQIGCGSSNVGSFSIDVASLATDPSASFNPAFATTPNVPFNRVEIRPQSGASFHVSEIRTCVAGVTCQTTLYPTGDQC